MSFFSRRWLLILVTVGLLAGADVGLAAVEDPFMIELALLTCDTPSVDPVAFASRELARGAKVQELFFTAIRDPYYELGAKRALGAALAKRPPAAIRAPLITALRAAQSGEAAGLTVLVRLAERDTHPDAIAALADVTWRSYCGVLPRDPDIFAPGFDVLAAASPDVRRRAFSDAIARHGFTCAVGSLETVLRNAGHPGPFDLEPLRLAFDRRAAALMAHAWGEDDAGLFSLDPPDNALAQLLPPLRAMLVDAMRGSNQANWREAAGWADEAGARVEPNGFGFRSPSRPELSRPPYPELAQPLGSRPTPPRAVSRPYFVAVFLALVGLVVVGFAARYRKWWVLGLVAVVGCAVAVGWHFYVAQSNVETGDIHRITIEAKQFFLDGFHSGRKTLDTMPNVRTRLEQIPFGKPTGEARVLLIGAESATGHDYRREESFLHIAVAGLAAKMPKHRVRAINGAVAGATPLDHLLRIKDYLRCSPDVVVLYVAEDSYARFRELATGGELLRTELRVDQLGEVAYPLRDVFEKLAHVALRLRDRQPAEPGMPPTGSNLRDLVDLVDETFVLALGEICAQCTAVGAKPLLVQAIAPNLDWRTDRRNALLARVARKYDAELVTTPAWLANEAADARHPHELFRDAGHVNRRGHALLAQAVTPALERSLAASIR